MYEFEAYKCKKKTIITKFVGNWKNNSIRNNIIGFIKTLLWFVQNTPRPGDTGNHDVSNYFLFVFTFQAGLS